MPETMRMKTEAFAKNILTQNPLLSKNLKWICYVSAFSQLRNRDQSYSIKAFSQRLGIKAKNIIKYMNEIKPYAHDGENQVKVPVPLENELSKDEEYFRTFLEKIDFSQILNEEANLAVSILNSNPKLKIEHTEDSIRESNEFVLIQERMKNRIKKYGGFLLRHEGIYSIKFGIKLENFVAAVILLVCKVFDFPITMKKLASVTGVSHISISRLKKDIALKLSEEYIKLSSLEKKELKKESEDSQTSEEQNADIDNKDLKKAIKFLYTLNKF
jgi:hypothetical protein